MTKQEYFNLVIPKIEAVNTENKIFNSVIIAQSALETGYGKSNLMLKANALFGIKAGSSWKGKIYNSKTKEVYQNMEVTENATFRAYDTIEDGIKDYLNLISTSSRYRKALTETTPEGQITAIFEGRICNRPSICKKSNEYNKYK